MRGRTLFADTWVGANGKQPIETYALNPVSDPDEEASAFFLASRHGLHVSKKVTLRDSKVIVDYIVESTEPGRFQVEIDVAMPCCDGYAGRFIHEGQILGGFGGLVALDEAQVVTLDDRYLDAHLTLSASRGVRLSANPYHTVSQSEDGLEKIMQSVTLTLTWPVTPGTQETSLVLAVAGGFDESSLGAATKREGVAAR